MYHQTLVWSWNISIDAHTSDSWLILNYSSIDTVLYNTETNPQLFSGVKCFNLSILIIELKVVSSHARCCLRKNFVDVNTVAMHDWNVYKISRASGMKERLHIYLLYSQFALSCNFKIEPEIQRSVSNV